jgi:hypothetical protein
MGNIEKEEWRGRREEEGGGKRERKNGKGMGNIEKEEWGGRREWRSRSEGKVGVGALQREGWEGGDMYSSGRGGGDHIR